MIAIEPSRDGSPNGSGPTGLRRGNLDDSVRLLRRAAAAAPGSADIQVGLGLILAALKRPDEAIVHYRRALAINPGLAQIHVNLAGLLVASQRPGEAIAHYYSALAINPDLADAHFHLANTLHAANRPADAIAHYRHALALAPAQAAAHNNLGNALSALKRRDEAIAHYQQALAIDSDLAETHSNLGILLAQRDGPAPALVHFQRALSLRPDLAEAHGNMGNALYALGRPHAAIAHYEKATTIRPDYAEVHSNLGVALQALGRHQEARARYQAALAIRPDLAEVHNNLGNVLRTLGDPEAAIVHYRRALALAPGYAPAHNNLGNALSALKRRDEAIAHYQQALAVDPDQAETHSNLGILLSERDGPAAALAHYERALSLRPDLAEAHGNMGNALAAVGRPHEAIAHFEKAIAIRPDLAEPHNGLGNALQAVGRLDAAYRAFEAAVKLAPRNGGFHLPLAHAMPFTAGDQRLAAMEELAGDMASLGEQDQIALNFALGKAYADLGQHERSFRHLLAGNARKRRQVAYDEPTMLRMFERISAAVSAELMQARRGAGDPSPVPVFVVGMPRSGTTLIEQILASHSQVFGAGELDDFGKAVPILRTVDGGLLPYPEVAPRLSGDDLHELGARYVVGLRARAPTASRIVDKMPTNFGMLGLIHLALPHARIIHVRRDPVDTCLSCFSILFVGDQPHTYDLGELGRYYRAYDGLMEHWRRVLPAGVMLEVRYEDVVDDLEGQARRIVAHCGLAWEDACLAFHQTRRPVLTASLTQVRQPIYRSSVGRWRPYGDLLQPLLRELDAASVEWAKEPTGPCRSALDAEERRS